MAGEVSVEGKPKEHIVWRQVQRASLLAHADQRLGEEPSRLLGKVEGGTANFWKLSIRAGTSGWGRPK